MYRIRVTIHRPYANVLVGHVVEMPQECRGIGLLGRLNTYEVRSDFCPGIQDGDLQSGHVLKLWGEEECLDGMGFSYNYQSAAEADLALHYFSTLIKRWNEAHATSRGILDNGSMLE